MAWLAGNAIHWIVNACLRMAQPEFFRRILILGEPLDDPKEHLIVVANHPYGIQDAFLVSLAYTRLFYFVATAKNFQTRDGDTIRKKRFISWFLTQCHVLPIVRDRSEGHMADNVRTFETAAKHIANGCALGIFAEGESRGNQWKLLKLKSGTAQIALQVADILKDLRKQVKIQVLGLTYTNWDKPFKSSVTLRLAPPFAVEPVDMKSKQAVRTARRAITERITRIMEEHTVHIPDEHRDLVGKIARFYSVEQLNDYERLREVGHKVAQLAEQFAGDRKDLEAKLDEYLELSEQLKIHPGEERSRRNKLLLLLAAIPAYAGYLIHWPILWATRKKVPRRTTVLHALGSKQVTWGIAFTLGWYALASLLVLVIGVVKLGVWGIPLTLAVIVVMAGCGIVASRYFRHVNMLFRGMLPSRRRFKRYRQLGEELFRRLEDYRRMAGQPDSPFRPDAQTVGGG